MAPTSLPRWTFALPALILCTAVTGCTQGYYQPTYQSPPPGYAPAQSVPAYPTTMQQVAPETTYQPETQEDSGPIAEAPDDSLTPQ